MPTDALSHYAELPAYTTRDDSEIREMMHPQRHGNAAQSLAEARIHPRRKTLLHRHRVSEELYHVTAGQGMLTLDNRQIRITVGDTVAIPPGTAHCVENTGEEVLTILCCCSPAYAHEDTELLPA